MNRNNPIESVYEKKMKYNQSHELYPEYYFTVLIERNFSGIPATRYMSSKFSYLYVISIIYIMIVFFGRNYMKNRNPFQLKSFSLYWNTILALFSLWGFFRMSSVCIQLYNKYGFDGMTCIPLLRSGPFALASVAFGFSKIVEFGDTFLLIVRKKPIIFLHWFHHVTVLLLAWHSLTSSHPSGRTFVSVQIIYNSMHVLNLCLYLIYVYICYTPTHKI